MAAKHQNVVGKFPPRSISSGGTMCVLCSGLRKISPGGNVGANNTDRQLGGMADDSPFLHFQVMGKSCFVHN